MTGHTSTPIMFTVNGDERIVDTPTTFRDVLAELGLPERGIAVALDGAVLPRARWGQDVERGAVIEILTAVQGG